MDLNEQIKVFRENGKSHDYIMGYLDCTFEVMKTQREELIKEIIKNLNEYKAKMVLDDRISRERR